MIQQWPLCRGHGPLHLARCNRRKLPPVTSSGANGAGSGSHAFAAERAHAKVARGLIAPQRTPLQGRDPGQDPLDETALRIAGADNQGSVGQSQGHPRTS